ncbi:MAG TPA: FHA domain-containing protein, partial [Clostridia bacterium]|nr:FHA domain-containing protein [Clostridia bacterium]
MVRLVINPGSSVQREVRLDSGRYSLGRGYANDFSIDDPSVSGTHCQIEITEDSIFITDLGSTNGTFIDGDLIAKAQLLPGQTFRLGSVPLQLWTESAAVPLDMPVAVATPPSPPPVAMPSAGSISSASGGQCKHHPKIPGRFVCPQCHHFFCELCVSSRSTGPVVRKTCRHCGVDCLPVQVQIHRPAEKGFFQRLPGAFLYPFRGAGVVIVIVGMVIVAGIRFGTLMMGFG